MAIKNRKVHNLQKGASQKDAYSKQHPEMLKLGIDYTV